MHNGLLWASVFLHTVIVVRLLLFKAKRGQQRRLGIGGLAWLLIVFNAACALYLLLGWTQPDAGQVAVLTLLAGLLMRCRGNVARLAG